MKKLLLTGIFTVLLCGLAQADQVGLFKRFMWMESITIPPGEIISTSVIDTSAYKTLVVQFTEVPGVPYDLMVCVETKLFDDENFRVTGLTGGQKTEFFLKNTSIEEPAKLVVGIYGTQTRLDLVNRGSTPVTLKITGALLRDSRAFAETAE